MIIKILAILQRLNSSTTCFALTLAGISLLLFFIQEGKRMSTSYGSGPTSSKPMAISTKYMVTTPSGVSLDLFRLTSQTLTAD